MLSGFQQYLVDKGFKRTCIEHGGANEKEDYESIFLSSYSPILYDFKKDDKWVWWGLCERGKPPVMYLGVDKIYVINAKDEFKSKEDGYRILFSKWREDRFDLIYDVLMTDKYFKINCEDENNIFISIEKR